MVRRQCLGECDGRYEEAIVHWCGKEGGDSEVLLFERRVMILDLNLNNSPAIFPIPEYWDDCSQGFYQRAQKNSGRPSKKKEDGRPPRQWRQRRDQMAATEDKRRRAAEAKAEAEAAAAAKAEAAAAAKVEAAAAAAAAATAKVEAEAAAKAEAEAAAAKVTATVAAAAAAALGGAQAAGEFADRAANQATAEGFEAALRRAGALGDQLPIHPALANLLASAFVANQVGKRQAFEQARKDTKEILGCCICGDPSTLPVTLHCGHHACKRCLDEWFTSCRERETTKDEPAPDKRQKCPECRAVTRRDAELRVDRGKHKVLQLDWMQDGPPPAPAL
jgi:hypothetical protein